MDVWNVSGSVRLKIQHLITLSRNTPGNMDPVRGKDIGYHVCCF